MTQALYLLYVVIRQLEDDKNTPFMDGLIVDMVSSVKGKLTPRYIWYLGSVLLHSFNEKRKCQQLD